MTVAAGLLCRLFRQSTWMALLACLQLALTSATASAQEKHKSDNADTVGWDNDGRLDATDIVKRFGRFQRNPHVWHRAEELAEKVLAKDGLTSIHGLATWYLVRTNARRTETFDHVGLFIDRNELRLPRANDNANAGRGALNDYDYGVFSFVDLFAQALHGVDFDQLTGAQTTNIRSRAAADVSDHLPIWVRVPIPGA